MAEPFGIVARAVGIATAFTACVDCFGYIQLGRHIGRDFPTDMLVLEGIQLRLIRWGQAVHVYEDPHLGMPDATAAELQTVHDTLFQILILFADTEKISDRYKTTSKPGTDVTAFSANDMEPRGRWLAAKLKELACRRQNGWTVLKTSGWALYHRSELQELMSNITSLIDNIVNLFPKPETQLAMARQEATEIHDKQALELLMNATQDVDPILHLAAKEVLGH